MTDRQARRLRKAELALRALAEHGNPDRAALALKIHPDTLRKRVMLYCSLKGYDSAVQAAYSLGLSDFPRKVA